MIYIIYFAILFLLICWVIYQKGNEEISMEEIRKDWKAFSIEAEKWKVINKYDLYKLENRGKYGVLVFDKEVTASPYPYSLPPTSEATKQHAYLCYYDKKNKRLPRYWADIYGIDANVIQAKINVQGFVIVYTNGKGRFRIDLDFLNKDIQELQ
jgi:hypothetical protein